jgi:hypothetical protein
MDIIDQIEHNKGIFDKKDIEYEYNDILIDIQGTTLNYRGKAEGFYWLKDMNEFFKIGFKDNATNKSLNDIRVQLQAVGIYTIGIKSLIKFINEELLKGYITGYCPITRADLNCFIQYDFSFLTKEMFSTRKRKYSTINEIGNAKSTQTIYIGKAPFLLRIYNKKEELKKNKKKNLMYEYFMNNNFDIQQAIFNVEFELHRTHLKQYKILTVDELLSNAKKLFKLSMEDIRLIDINSISKKELENNKYNATTLSIWKYIKNQYDIKEFLQTELSLTRIKRAVSIYDDIKFKTDMVATIRRGLINRLNIDVESMDYYYFEAKRSLEEPTTTKELKKTYEELENYINPQSKQKEKVRVLEDGTIIKPINVVSVKELSNLDLFQYLDKLSANKNLSKKDYDLWYIAYKEAMQRGLLPMIGNDEAIGEDDD